MATLGRFGSLLNLMCWELCPKLHKVGRTLDLVPTLPVGHMPAFPLSSHDQPELICLYYHYKWWSLKKKVAFLTIFSPLN